MLGVLGKESENLPLLGRVFPIKPNMGTTLPLPRGVGVIQINDPPMIKKMNDVYLPLVCF